jgi:hypothetical protein
LQIKLRKIVGEALEILIPKINYILNEEPFTDIKKELDKKYKIILIK